jgi:hypothetical protein
MSIKIHRIPQSLLDDVAQVSIHYQRIREFKRKDDETKNIMELSKMLAIQEGYRLLKNYNYMKDTEAINQYAIMENNCEMGLLKRASYAGLIIDRYI